MKEALALLGFIALTGCASYVTHQSDSGSGTNRVTTTKVVVRTFFSAKSELAKSAVSQTDKTQSSKVGSVVQESSGTNAVQILQELKGIVQALPK